LQPHLACVAPFSESQCKAVKTDMLKNYLRRILE